LALLEKVVGGRVSKVYLERAETLVFADGMSPEVVNALLLHTLASMQMELPKAYMETIRDSWKAKRIATVDEAVKQI
ncbi:DnaD domain protein, partial [Staphylococcus aureus]|nr:DnaD domain protein [Staphylococcus aureus]